MLTDDEEPAASKPALDARLADLHAAHPGQALTNPPRVLRTLTWESSSWRSTCSLCLSGSPTRSILSRMSSEEVSACGTAPGVFGCRHHGRIKPLFWCLVPS
ncbi:hypothetical protein ATANTOWER_010139 [Ataeniobius toweri]|uniref:Uncharacterized protein n=1 Tax=Ataeniobius toweri TaxID=208326 RepID=A0ABU7BPG8_9TELE|nr:hypothetical protein [Ataeniobius toweri]